MFEATVCAQKATSSHNQGKEYEQGVGKQQMSSSQMKLQSEAAVQSGWQPWLPLLYIILEYLTISFQSLKVVNHCVNFFFKF